MGILGPSVAPGNLSLSGLLVVTSPIYSSHAHALQMLLVITQVGHFAPVQYQATLGLYALVGAAAFLTFASFPLSGPDNLSTLC